MASARNDLKKVVYSSSLQETTWPNSRIFPKLEAAEIPRWKADSDKDLLTIGSPGLVAELTRHGLMDDYYFSIQPLIAGGGESRLFSQGGLNERQPLKYMDIRHLASGVQILHYQKF